MSGKKAETTPTIASQKSMGGAHNVAMAVLTEKSNQFKRQQKAQKNTSFFSGVSSAHVSAEQYQKNLSSTLEFATFIATLALCIASFVTIKTYHTHLEKQDQLTALLKNPNARVAAGK